MADLITIPEFRLESGAVLRQAPVSYWTWGRLNAARDNVLVVCHALTGNADAATWWKPLVGPGRALDTNRFFVVCLNALGSPYGTASPVTVNPETGQRYGPDFPQTTVRDTVRLHRRALEQLGVEQVAVAVGGSMGGMQALEWSFYGDFVQALVPIAVGGRHSPWQIGWSEAQRQAIYADPCWQDGRYDPDDPPAGGLAAARMTAMVSYRSRASFEKRFGRERMDGGASSEEPFSVESYLRYQGKKLVKRFDANCYVHMTKQMDTHDVARGRGPYREVLRTIQQPALVVGIPSDVLYPLEEQRELVTHLPRAELALLESPHGHDAFLIELETLNDMIDSWITKNVSIEAESATPVGS